MWKCRQHAPIEEIGFANLNSGFHKIKLEFFQAGGGISFETCIEGPDLEKQIMPSSMLYTKNKIFITIEYLQL